MFQNFEHFLAIYLRMENLKYSNYKSKNIETKCLSNMWINRFLKVNNSFLELENDFTGLKDGELKDRKLKIKKEIEELFFEPIIVSII